MYFLSRPRRLVTVRISIKIEMIADRLFVVRNNIFLEVFALQKPKGNLKMIDTVTGHMVYSTSILVVVVIKTMCQPFVINRKKIDKCANKKFQ